MAIADRIAEQLAGGASEEEAKAQFNINAPQAEQNVAISDEFTPDPLNWGSFVIDSMARYMAAWANQNGVSPLLAGNMLTVHSTALLQAINDQLLRKADQSKIDPNRLPPGADINQLGQNKFTMGSNWYIRTMEGMNEMLDFALNFMGAKAGIDLTGLSSGGGGGGGGGRRYPTAEEIRNQFDMEQLANMVNDINRGLVLQDHPNAKKLAREYVDSVVATKGQKQIDFETFVRSKVEETSRFKSIYGNKPKAVTPEQYIAPYLAAALRLGGGEDQAGELAIAGAQFGASQQQFEERLSRTDEVTSSSPYIAGLENRLQSLNEIFRE